MVVNLLKPFGLLGSLREDETKQTTVSKNSIYRRVISVCVSVHSGTKVVRTINSLTETILIFVFTWFAINELIFKRV